jgi:hypothetical protein
MANRAITKVAPTIRAINWRSLLGRGAVISASVANAPTVASLSQTPIRPTELGLELLRRLPPYAATIVDIPELNCSQEGKTKTAARIKAFERVAEIAQAIVARPTTEVAHLIDLAIVARWEYDSNYPTSHGAECRMVEYFLKLGGIAEAECDMEVITARHKPTRKISNRGDDYEISFA